MTAAAQSPQALAQAKDKVLRDAKEREAKIEEFKKRDALRAHRVILSGITTKLVKPGENTHDEVSARMFVKSLCFLDDSQESEIESIDVWKPRNVAHDEERYMMAIQFKDVATRNKVIDTAKGNYVLRQAGVRVFGDQTKVERAKETQEKRMREVHMAVGKEWRGYR